MNYGLRLRDYRIKHGYSLDELAKKLDSTKSSVAMVERGSRPLSVEMAVRAAEVFGVPMEMMLGIKVRKER